MRLVLASCSVLLFAGYSGCLTPWQLFRLVGPCSYLSAQESAEDELRLYRMVHFSVLTVIPTHLVCGHMGPNRSRAG